MKGRSQAVALLVLAVVLVAVGVGIGHARSDEGHGFDPTLRIPDPPRRADNSGPVRPPGADKQLPLQVSVLNKRGPSSDGTFTFTARLTNPTDHDIDLDPCPYYRMGVYLDDHGDSAYYRIDCDRVERVRANGHVDLPMVQHSDMGAIDLSDVEIGFTYIWQLWGPGFNAYGMG